MVVSPPPPFSLNRDSRPQCFPSLQSTCFRSVSPRAFPFLAGTLTPVFTLGIILPIILALVSGAVLESPPLCLSSLPPGIFLATPLETPPLLTPFLYLFQFPSLFINRTRYSLHPFFSWFSLPHWCTRCFFSFFYFYYPPRCPLSPVYFVRS